MTKKSTIHDPRFEAMLKLLKDARIAKGMTQEELSAKLGQHRIYINKVESGQRRLDVVELNDLCKAVGISIHDVIEATFNNTPSEAHTRSHDYILGFSNGFIQAKGYEGDRAPLIDILKAEQEKSDSN